MRREIKFRGKRKDNGEWVYGQYFIAPLTDENSGLPPEVGWFFLSGETKHCIARDGVAFVIDIQTLGQYTGLHDMKGVEVYEGDVAKVEDYVAAIEWDVETCRFVVNMKSENLVYDFDYFYGKELEIIGSIHDNPEFLAEEATP